MAEAYSFLGTIEHFITDYSPKFLGALLVLMIGFWLAGWLTKLTRKGMHKRGFDVSLQSFLSSMVNVLFKVILLVTVAGMLGIQTTSFVAILGAAGLAVGLALQGSLGNFAGGVLTLVFKPYVVGDLIEALGQFGEVKEIQIFNTILITSDNKTVILPNGAVSNGTIINLSRQGNLRVNIQFLIDGEMNIARAKALILDVCDKNEHTLKEPAASVHVQKIQDGDIQLIALPFCTPNKYWDTSYTITEEVKIAFQKEGIRFSNPVISVVQK